MSASCPVHLLTPRLLQMKANIFAGRGRESKANPFCSVTYYQPSASRRATSNGFLSQPGSVCLAWARWPLASLLQRLQWEVGPSSKEIVSML
jgi:hypothetical protein